MSQRIILIFLHKKSLLTLSIKHLQKSQSLHRHCLSTSKKICQTETRENFLLVVLVQIENKKKGVNLNTQYLLIQGLHDDTLPKDVITPVPKQSQRKLKGYHNGDFVLPTVKSNHKKSGSIHGLDNGVCFEFLINYEGQVKFLGIE